MEVSGCQPSDRSPGSQKADGKPRGHLQGGARNRAPGPRQERWLRVEHACWLRHDSRGPSQAWLPGAHPASTPCWLAGLYLSCVFSTHGKLLRLCPTLCDHMDRSLLTVVLSSSDFDYICKGLFLDSVPASSHLHSSQPLGGLHTLLSATSWCRSRQGNSEAQLEPGGKIALSRGCGSPVGGGCLPVGRAVRLHTPSCLSEKDPYPFP